MFTLISKKVLNESTGEVEEVVLNEDELMDHLMEATFEEEAISCEDMIEQMDRELAEMIENANK